MSLSNGQAGSSTDHLTAFLSTSEGRGSLHRYGSMWPNLSSESHNAIIALLRAARWRAWQLGWQGARRRCLAVGYQYPQPDPSSRSPRVGAQPPLCSVGAGRVRKKRNVRHHPFSAPRKIRYSVRVFRHHAPARLILVPFGLHPI